MSKLLKNMKVTLVWTLVALLSFEPAAMAAGSKTSTMDDLKSFLETSHVTKKSQTFQEYLRGKEKLFSPDVYAKLMDVATTYPDAMIPKIDVTKVKGPNGEEQIQLSAIQDGKAASAVIVGGKKVFLKVNGKTLSPAEMQNSEIYFKKVGLSDTMVDRFFANRNVASEQPGILTVEQINKLPLKEKKLYFKQFRQLLESVEAVQQMQQGTTSSSRTPTNDFFAQLAFGPNAVAAPGENCVVAGYNDAQTVNNPNREVNGKVVGGETCGSDPQGNIVEKYNGDCQPRHFLCNPLVYGSHRPLCIKAGRDTTAQCNAAASSNDIPRNTDLTSGDAPNDFAKLQSKALTQGRMAAAVCANWQSHQKQGMRDDQQQTCSDLNARIATIESWKCYDTGADGRPALTAFGNEYKKICPQNPGGSSTDPKDPSKPPIIGGTDQDQKPPGGDPSQQPPMPPDGKVYCNALPNNMILVADANAAKMKNGCEAVRGAIVFNDPKGCQDSKGDGQPTYTCNCSGGAAVTQKMTCPNPVVVGGSDGGDSGKDKSKKKKKKGEDDGPNWWLIGGVGLLALGAFYWMAKSSNDDAYKYIEPVPPAPPVPAPVPRTTQ